MDRVRELGRSNEAIGSVIGTIAGIGTLLGHIDEIQTTVAGTAEEQQAATSQRSETVNDVATTCRDLLASQEH